jgi:hypothetical protein
MIPKVCQSGEIPDYGINKSNIRGGFSYQILYRLPFGGK